MLASIAFLGYSFTSEYKLQLAIIYYFLSDAFIIFYNKNYIIL